ncbi:hypothetical protein AUJ77_03440 [Candidatus Nomurabacteria bacterium CG1_02_43_90]|uniref:Uncharacterized protein n=1 Tax=Candidatus Nomurabacteria bacterium CG1_02_43_90 TaxID=1805281 RepID=A0A1J4V643_9BACT|nr:MAG: hypothetical protein AUJ77_03440 [Candidatus Nomurabacteria bacterium CG1_02_43_90]
MAKIIKAKIENLKYRAGTSMRKNKLNEYKLADFDVNEASASGIVEIDEKNKVAYSKWVTPKRTRSYPFARIYDTYSFGGKRITIIPIIKDEGIGASKNKSNNDRINFITLSWMNLTNVFVILAWYSDAEKKTEYRITSQKFDTNYIKKKIKEISEYQFDAHHWNNEHFIKDFRDVYEKAVSSYDAISEKLSVKLHPSSGHKAFLEKIIDKSNPKTISLNNFASETLAKSRLAAAREVVVKHKNEHLSLESEKLVFEIVNNLGGSYFLTADEIIIDEDKKQLIIQEAKNATTEKLPKSADIKDGLFKILLFSQIKTIHIDEIKYDYKVSLKLTGRISSSLKLPTTQENIASFVHKEKISRPDTASITMLNEEATENDYEVEITNN